MCKVIQFSLPHLPETYKREPKKNFPACASVFPMLQYKITKNKRGLFVKKVILIILSVLLALLICLAVFWEPILDALPIDQSGWRTRDG